MRFSGAGIVAVAVVCMGLAACGDRGVHIACPDVRILQNTERLTEYRDGPGRDITDIVLEAEVQYLSGECKVGKEQVVMDFPIAVGARRGPANSKGVSDVTLFLAVATRDREILSRRELPFRLIFPGNRLNIVNAERVEIKIPRKEGQPVTDFQIFIGFELTKGQLEFNRTQRRR